METSTKMGRPSKEAKPEIYESTLYKMLLANLPCEHVKCGRIDTESLSRKLGCARFTVYQWFHKNSLSRQGVKWLVELSKNTKDREKKGALTKESLLPFYLKF